jgi:hypothetical protein
VAVLLQLGDELALSSDVALAFSDVALGLRKMLLGDCPFHHDAR